FHSTYDSRVLKRIQLGLDASAADYIVMQRRRQALIQTMETPLRSVDAMISPTVPITAPAIADLAPGDERDAAFFKVNAQLLRNPSVVNFSDGCAISIPCHHSTERPVGLMIWQRGGLDGQVLGIAKQLSALVNNENN
ncbi:MAG: amidase family protein, partial [Burkholderiaceae bacterium]